MSYQEIIYEVEDRVATITLNRPETLNAFTETMIQEWADALQRAQRDDNVWVVVVTGAGRGFCSGGNVKGFAYAAEQEAPPLHTQRNHMRYGVHQVPRAVAQLDKPYIAAVNGPAAGAGMDMASMADIRIASDRAKFVMSYINMGLVTGDGGAYYLPRIVGLSKAYELMWFGEPIDAYEALRIGYVSHVVPHEQFPQFVKDYARKLASKPPIAVQLIKRAVRKGLSTDLDNTLDFLEWAMLICRSTEDAKEGPRAWREKRPPVFTGR
ncbi:MAG: enoyl-CoA hydratase [Candidatus Tectimicrobiota bacterium]|nr:MAG: enoyl-CoA hydratase [Candidatus Tectomicrobia bacterium]